MTHRERMFAAVRGEPTDSLPWAPRLDLWYNANRLAGTLPREFAGSSLVEIVDALGAGFHAVVPDFRETETPESGIDRGLGIYNLRQMPVHTVLRNIGRSVRVEGARTTVEYHTPVGSVCSTAVFDEDMRRAGITISHLERCAFRSQRDYAPLTYIFEQAQVEPNYEGYSRFARSVGERGIAVGFVNGAASPMHLVQRDLMPVDLFFYETKDHPRELARLAETIGDYWGRQLKLAADSPARVLFLGGNYDSTITYPPFFREYIEPWLSTFAAMLHERGKYLLTHTDGENTGLLEHYLESRIDIADSVCPSPMTRLTLRQVRDVFDGRVTIMGGIPSVSLLSQTMSERAFDEFLDAFFADLGRGDHLILGVSDTTPPAAEFGRIRKIGERVREFGPVE